MGNMCYSINHIVFNGLMSKEFTQLANLVVAFFTKLWAYSSSFAPLGCGGSWSRLRRAPLGEAYASSIWARSRVQRRALREREEQRCLRVGGVKHGENAYRKEKRIKNFFVKFASFLRNIKKHGCLQTIDNFYCYFFFHSMISQSHNHNIVILIQKLARNRKSNISRQFHQ